MYYKIENTESEVYQKLKALRLKELQIEKENEEAIKDKIGNLQYKTFLVMEDNNHLDE